MMQLSKIILVVFALVITKPSFSQVEINPYQKALELHLKEVLKFDENLEFLNIQYDPHINDLPDTINGVGINLIGPKLLEECTKKNKEMEMTIIKPLQWADSNYHILIIHYHVSRKRKKYSFAKEYASKFTLEYDCEVGKYDLILSQ